MKIEGTCKCGRCVKRPSELDWVIRGLNHKPGRVPWYEGHCPHCGDGLAIENVSGKGLVYEMVRADSVAKVEAERKWWRENSLVFTRLYCRSKYQEGIDCSERDCEDCRAAYFATEPWNQSADEGSDDDDEGMAS